MAPLPVAWHLQMCITGVRYAAIEVLQVCCHVCIQLSCAAAAPGQVPRPAPQRCHALVRRAQCFGPLALFHVEGKEAIEERATSIQNAAEARMVLALYQELRTRYSHLSSSNQIAVISPYKAQVLHCLGTAYMHSGSLFTHDVILLPSSTLVAWKFDCLYAFASLLT